MRPEVVPWWEQAQADLETARVTAAADRHYATSWFAQQAAEKAIKAPYIEQLGVLAPRTHDLAQLGTLVGAPAHVLTDPRALAAPVNLVDAPMATGHVEAAERVLSWVQTQFP
jgi:HEPN domain-containing protein